MGRQVHQGREQEWRPNCGKWTVDDQVEQDWEGLTGVQWEVAADQY